MKYTILRFFKESLKRKGDGENCEDLGVCEILQQTVHRNQSENMGLFHKIQRTTGICNSVTQPYIHVI